MMYAQYLKVKLSGTGQGVFTSIQIPADVPILEVRGPIYLEQDLPDPNHPALLQVGTNTFIAASGGPDDYLNHSCNPNCMMHVAGNRAVLYSLYVIAAGSELTFDYSTTATDDHAKWTMPCACGQNNCRKNISGFQYLDPTLQKSLIDRGMVPLYITQPNMFPKK
jgi:hypothetical protein